MELIDNVNKTLAEDLRQTIKANSKIAIAASCFSIYAYQEFKEQLEGIDQLQFIFTSPTFTTEKAKKEKLQSTQNHVQRMNENVLKDKVSTFLSAHPEFCDDFNG